MDPFLKPFIERGYGMTAENRLKFVERPVRGKVVLGKDDMLLEKWRHNRVLLINRVVACEGPGAAGFRILLRILVHPTQRIGPFPRIPQNDRAEIRRINPASGQ